MFHTDSEKFSHALSVGLSARWCARLLAFHPPSGHSVLEAFRVERVQVGRRLTVVLAELLAEGRRHWRINPVASTHGLTRLTASVVEVHWNDVTVAFVDDVADAEWCLKSDVLASFAVVVRCHILVEESYLGGSFGDQNVGLRLLSTPNGHLKVSVGQDLGLSNGWVLFGGASEQAEGSDDGGDQRDSMFGGHDNLPWIEMVLMS